MQRLHRIIEWNLLVVEYTEPFSSADLLDAARAAGVPGRGPSQHLCVLVDLRKVANLKLAGSDSRSFASVRKERIAGQRAEPVAFLLKDMRELGTLRMHNQWVEALGLRDEKDTFVTTSLQAALDWIEARTFQRGLAAALASRSDIA